MSNKKSWDQMGNEWRESILTGMKTGDFTDLGDTIVDMVQTTLDGVVDTTQTASKVASQTYQNKTQQLEAELAARKRAEAEQRAKVAKTRAPFVRKGETAGILQMIFGGFNAGLFGLSTFFALMEGIFLSENLIAAIILAGITYGFIHMFRSGNKKRKRLKRAEAYLNLAGHNHYINIDELAAMTNQTKTFTLKDVKEMIQLGIFPEGHLDRKKTCLMLDNNIYQEYVRIEKQRKEEEKLVRQERTVAEQTGEKLAKEEASSESGEIKDKELLSMILEGQNYIRQIREVNERIPGEIISKKLFRMESLLSEIFDQLRVHPEQKSQMKKMMSYYLPTTMKLVSAYEEFDQSPSQSREMLEAKGEIEKTIDTINIAFEEVLKRMYREKAFDVTTDAQVLQTMLNNEGLVGSIFDQEEEPSKESQTKENQSTESDVTESDDLETTENSENQTGTVSEVGGMAVMTK